MTNSAMSDQDWHPIATAPKGDTSPMARTQKAIVECGYWLAECLRLGWSRQQLDFLEELWWKHHDDHGHLKQRVEEGPMSAAVRRPINTAPKDQTIAVWNGEWWSPAYHSPEGWCADVDGELLRIDPQPTHWMPLPAPPHQETDQ
jgi:hypothetical protein